MSVQDCHAEQKILVVDDDELLLTLIETVLADEGYRIETASSYQLAQKALLANTHFDLILLDQYLSDGFGTDLLRLMNEKSVACEPPVLMIGGGDDSGLLEECFSLGIADYIVKPLHLELLKLKVDTLLREQQLQEQLESRHNQVSTLLENIRQDQEMARFVYEHLMSRYHEPLPNITANIIPHSVFSGDMILSVTSPSGNVLALVADATGHGLAAALTMIPVIPAFATMASKGISLPLIVSEINEKLLLETPDNRFVAAVAIELDIQRGRLRVWNGGMPDAYWIPDDGSEITAFPSTNLPLGVVERGDFTSAGQSLGGIEAGELIIMSDGVTDILYSNGEKPEAQVRRTLGENAKGARFSALLNLMGPLSGEPEDDISLFSLDHSSVKSVEGLAPVVSVKCLNWSMTQTGAQLADNSLVSLASQAWNSALLPADKQQVAFTILTELVNNSLDHGLLGLDSRLKEDAENFEVYLRERELRFGDLANTDYICVELELDQKQLTILVKDSGAGYTFVGDKKMQGELSGRGLALIESLCDEFEVAAPGNIAKAIIKLVHN
ncbi:fused response regulator/phosphatase [Gilvimarinus sp. SDUM040013]|uniref:Fused response regulator/phosphatase n=1 Tax=Gilvimarinus gilvus TaxID=3058038 RepID=A0ABU4RSW7_9GAMM|nr:fused response regulator/phosphatase [Gilvimarinus sp. SDUM040013]MDO3388425.1 fused response regulator/phosphatase [Gilvimarinus sp. SDUM040013]MDX6847975.1 fused response regulator/phosphatase [Gilvimarinus sp. SDUM040013]